MWLFKIAPRVSYFKLIWGKAFNLDRALSMQLFRYQPCSGFALLEKKATILKTDFLSSFRVSITL